MPICGSAGMPGIILVDEKILVVRSGVHAAKVRSSFGPASGEERKSSVRRRLTGPVLKCTMGTSLVRMGWISNKGCYVFFLDISTVGQKDL